MFYTDTVTKTFLTYGNNLGRAERAARLLGIEDTNPYTAYQDPTYNGFYFRILESGDYSNGLDYDYYPMGLFLPTDDPDSAASYLRRKGEYYRASMIEEFREGFQKVVNEMPWYFVSVSGLADVWKINPGNSWKGKDKKITFTTLEDVSLKMTYLMDLYRKAVFDSKWMRYVLPENQRMFAMELNVSEVRTLQRPNFGPTAVNPITGRRNTSIFNTGTFLTFRFEQCTFDLFNDSPKYLETLTRSPGEMATNNMSVITPVITEKNSYGLLGGLLKDTPYARNRGQIEAQRNFFKNQSQLENAAERSGIINGLLNYIQAVSRENVGPGNLSREAKEIFLQAASPVYQQVLGILQGAATNSGVNMGLIAEDLGNIELTGQDIRLLREIIGDVYPGENGSEATSTPPTPSTVSLDSNSLPATELPPVPSRISFTEGGVQLVRNNIGNNYN
jgi:hypothetical protein